MTFSTIQDIAEATNKSTGSLLNDIKGLLGDEHPQVHQWNAQTKLPDDPLAMRILEFYNLKNEVSFNLPKGELTTLPEVLLATASSENQALTLLVQDLRNSFADYFGAALTAGVVNAYQEGKAQALEVLTNLVDNDLADIDMEMKKCLESLKVGANERYKKGELDLGKRVRESFQRSEGSRGLRSELSSLAKGLKSH